MNFIRNTLAILVGLLVTAVIITLGVRINPSWVTYPGYSLFQNWKMVLFRVHSNHLFFVVLLICSGIGSMVGGIITAFLVKCAKVAYAILIGFISLFIAMMDIIINPYHPTFYKIAIFLIFFPSSWLGGKIVEACTGQLKRKKKKRKRTLRI